MRDISARELKGHNILYTPQRMQETIIKLLEAWQKKRQRDQER